MHGLAIFFFSLGPTVVHDGELALSIKRSASDRLGDLVP